MGRAGSPSAPFHPTHRSRRFAAIEPCLVGIDMARQTVRILNDAFIGHVESDSFLRRQDGTCRA